MRKKRIIPADAPGDFCTFTITSDGSTVPATSQFSSITVNKEINQIPSATLIIMDGEPSNEAFSVSDAAAFQPGKEVEVKAGYQDKEETIFRGIVIKHGLKVGQSGAMVIIECLDKGVKMSVCTQNRYFKDQKDSEIMAQLVDRYGIEVELQQTYLHHEQVVQYNCTDWDFLRSRAEINGLFCYLENGKLIVAKPDFSAETVLELQYGATIHRLDAEIDARLQFKAVKVTTWSSAENEVVANGEIEDPLVPDAGNISSAALADVIGNESLLLWYSGNFTEQELQQRANAIMLKHKLAKITGKVTIDGTSAVKPGQLIQLDGIGKRFEGRLFVTGVSHVISGGKWETVIQFGLKPEWFADPCHLQQPKGNVWSSGIQGLQIGVVTALEGDPAGEDRIMVRLPNINDDDKGIWTRISTLDAGKERGTFFRPEIGDEVIVGFINNDAQFAVMLGMVNSSNKPAPMPTSDTNPEKGYISRSKMKISFNDDTRTINIETPSGNSLILSEDTRSIIMKDQHGNKILMDENGIGLESIKDIRLKAATDVNIEGVETNITAGALAKMKGGSATEISSDAAVTIKGSVVQIN